MGCDSNRLKTSIVTGFDNELPLVLMISMNESIFVFKDECLNREKFEAQSMINAMCLSPDHSLLAVGCQNNGIELWDIENMQMMSTLYATKPIQDLLFCPNRYWLIAANGAKINIWDLETKDCVAEIFGHQMPDVELLCDGTLIEKIHSGPKIKQRRSKRKRTRRMLIKPNCLRFSCDGKNLFVGCTDGAINIYRVLDSLW